MRPSRPLIAAAVAVAACGWTLFPATLNAQGIWGPYGWFPPFAYGQPYSSVRLQISPRNTEVFVDGYYAGIVDDFDGFMQRLHVEAGEHTVQLYLAGHRTAEQKIYLQPGGTFRIRHTMEPLAAGESAPPRPSPPPRPAPSPTTASSDAAAGVNRRSDSEGATSQRWRLFGPNQDHRRFSFRYQTSSS